MTDSSSGTCTRCGLADVTCHLVLSPEFARALRVPTTQFVENGLCDRCWDELFGHDPEWERFVRRRVRIGPREMERAQAMIEREPWRPRQ